MSGIPNETTASEIEQSLRAHMERGTDPLHQEPRELSTLQVRGQIRRTGSCDMKQSSQLQKVAVSKPSSVHGSNMGDDRTGHCVEDSYDDLPTLTTEMMILALRGVKKSQVQEASPMTLLMIMMMTLRMDFMKDSNGSHLMFQQTFGF